MFTDFRFSVRTGSFVAREWGLGNRERRRVSEASRAYYPKELLHILINFRGKRVPEGLVYSIGKICNRGAGCGGDRCTYDHSSANFIDMGRICRVYMEGGECPCEPERHFHPSSILDIINLYFDLANGFAEENRSLYDRMRWKDRLHVITEGMGLPRDVDSEMKKWDSVYTVSVICRLLIGGEMYEWGGWYASHFRSEK